jgi:HrpJ-like domain
MATISSYGDYSQASQPLDAQDLRGTVVDARSARSVASGAQSGAMSPANASDWQANATEELTFQFSALVETHTKSLEERLNAVPDHVSQLRIDRVRQLLRMLEGDQAHTRIRATVESMVQAYQGNPGVAGIDQRAAEPSGPAMEPARRYAFMRLALNELETRKADPGALAWLHDELDTLYTEHGVQIRAALNIAPVMAESDISQARAKELRDAYYELLNAKLSPRFLFERLLQLGAGNALTQAHALLQRAFWSDLQSLHPSMDRLKLHRCAYEVMTMGQICQTLVAQARTLLSKFSPGYPGPPENDRDLEVRCAKEMLALADSMNPPRAMLERIGVIAGANTKSAQAAPALAAASTQKEVLLYNHLFRQIQQWPPTLWAMPDRKDTVAAQLRKLLDALQVKALHS